MLSVLKWTRLYCRLVVIQRKREWVRWLARGLSCDAHDQLHGTHGCVEGGKAGRLATVKARVLSLSNSS